MTPEQVKRAAELIATRDELEEFIADVTSRIELNGYDNGEEKIRHTIANETAQDMIAAYLARIAAELTALGVKEPAHA